MGPGSSLGEFIGNAGDPDLIGIIARTTVAGVAGGTVSVIGGGKFANGAYTSAFQHLLNAEGPNGAQKRQRRGNGKYPEYHYARNDENDQWLKNNGLYGRSDITLDQVKEAGEYGMKQASDAENVYHRNGEGNENNLKFTSRIATKENWWQRNVSNRYGRYELILRPNGDNTFTHVTESINMGTLNRGNNFVTHFVEDVLPYLQLGNTRE